MKFFIVGKHSSGKLETLNLLEELGVKVAREFSNLEQYHPNIYIDKKYLKYSQDDIETIFNNRSFISMSPLEENNILDGYKYYRGIDFYNYDLADAMVLNPRQVTFINKNMLNKKTIFVWMDNNRDSRIHNHVQENRSYDFIEIEKLETPYDSDFVKTIYNLPNSHILYFNNECPERVASIIYSIIKHPDLLDIFTKYYN